MATLGELCRQHTSLTRDEINHLKQLVSEWGLLADLCFADLLLYVPSNDAEWLIVAQVRPATGQTIYLADYVGSPADNERPLLTAAFDSGGICEGEIAVDLPEPARMLAIPVRCGGKPIAVLSREWSNKTGRQPGELERPEAERTTWKQLFELRELALPELEKARQAKAIGKALEAKLTFAGSSLALAAASPHLDALRELLNVSQLEIRPEGEATVTVTVSKAAGEKCERCWHWETDVGSHHEHPTICARCVKAVQASARV